MRCFPNRIRSYLKLADEMIFNFKKHKLCKLCNTFIFYLNYLLWKLKTSKRQVVSFLLETKHKVFRFKTKPIPRMLGQDDKRSLKILVANVQLSVTFATGWPQKYGGVFVFKFWGLRGS